MTLWKTADGVSLDALAEEATVSDLVEALQAEGAGWTAESISYLGMDLPQIPVEARGRYLLVALDTLGEDA